MRVALVDALQGLRSGRGTTLLAFIILAVSMSMATVTFSVVDTIALRPLPYSEPDRLVALISPDAEAGAMRRASPQEYISWLAAVETFESLGASAFGRAVRLKVDGGMEVFKVERITANLFDVLGVRPVAGKLFGVEHEQVGGPSGVILSHKLWVRRFGADPRVIGRRLTFEDGTREVVGVLPADVAYPITVGASPDLYLPYVLTAKDRASDAPRRTVASVVGRLRSGVTLEQARADASRFSAALLVPLHDQVVGTSKRWLLLILTAVTFLLLVACANVANLLLARTVTRTTELATREALGASRRQLTFGLLLEGLILAVASTAAAIVVSIWGVEIAKANLPPGLARVPSIAVDVRVMSAAAAAAVICALVCTSTPARVVARNDLVSLMKATGGVLVNSQRRDRSLFVFLAADVALVCALLVATTLVVTSFVLVTTVDLSFDRRDVIIFPYQTSLKEVAEPHRAAAAAALRSNLLARAKSVPGVTEVAIALNGSVPLSGSHVKYSIEVVAPEQQRTDEMLETNMVTPDYFRVMRMKLIRGRFFDVSDQAGAPPVMLINDVAARRYFKDLDPIGQVVTFRGPTTVVGILRGVRMDGPEAAVRPEMYTPLEQERFQGQTAYGSLVVRTTGDARRLAVAIREAITPVLGHEASQPQFVDDDFQRLTAGRRFNASLMAVFGLIAVMIGAIGVYGTTTFFVTKHVRAIGLRIALGATRARVVGAVVRGAMLSAGIGIAIGWAVAILASNVLESFMFGIHPTDVIVYVAVGAFLAIVALLGAFIPAWRAVHLDPLVALREN